MIKKLLTASLMTLILLMFVFTNPTSGASDWKKCGTDLYIMNPLKEKIIYNILWLDHDIEKYKGQSIPRCGGELKPGGGFKVGGINGDFKLCPGRHVAIFHIVIGGTGGRTVKVQPYGFVIKATDDSIILAPTGVAAKAYKEPEKKKGDTIWH